jgi:hypothetical protein
VDMQAFLQPFTAIYGEMHCHAVMIHIN